MVACFIELRKDCLNNLLAIKLFNDCVMDVLTGSISTEIRIYMEKFLRKLCQLEVQQQQKEQQQRSKCKDHLINLIIKARLPLWVNSSLSRSSTQRLILQSTQYFNLRAALLENMTIEEQSAYSINLNKMLNDEVNWLIYFSPTKSLKDIDNILLTGHLNLTRALLTCETANKVNRVQFFFCIFKTNYLINFLKFQLKSDVGAEMIPALIKTYLFPAAYLINNPSEDTAMEPICSNESTRLAAYKLLGILFI
jgi:hypothetical protein